MEYIKYEKSRKSEKLEIFRGTYEEISELLQDMETETEEEEENKFFKRRF